jgi:hypothetical protein
MLTLVETLVLDGFHKSLGVRIALGAPRWNLHAFRASRFQDRREPLGEQWIPVVDQVRRPSKKSFDRIYQIARHLFHPLPIGIDANSHDLDRNLSWITKSTM